MTEHVGQFPTSPTDIEGTKRSTFLAAGSVLGAVGASSCCLIPLALLSLGLGGAWMGRLMAFAPYQPYFIAITFACLGAGFYFVYRRPQADCAQTCDPAGAPRATKIVLWGAAVLLFAAIAYQYVLPLLLEI